MHIAVNKGYYTWHAVKHESKYVWGFSYKRCKLFASPACHQILMTITLPFTVGFHDQIQSLVSRLIWESNLSMPICWNYWQLSSGFVKKKMKRIPRRQPTTLLKVVSNNVKYFSENNVLYPPNERSPEHDCLFELSHKRVITCRTVAYSVLDYSEFRT